jgi:hypothetical protein
MRAARMAPPSERRDQVQVNGLAADSAGADDSPPPPGQPDHPIDCSQMFVVPDAPAGAAGRPRRGRFPRREAGGASRVGRSGTPPSADERLLFSPQRDDGINTGGAPRRHVTGQHCDCR